MTPAIHNTETLVKLQACSKNGVCWYVIFIWKLPLLIAAKQMLNLNNQKPPIHMLLTKYFMTYGNKAKRPQMTYFKQKQRYAASIDVELTLLFEDVEKLTPLTPEVKEQLTHLAAAYTKDGMVHQTYEAPIFAMYWNVL